MIAGISTSDGVGDGSSAFGGHIFDAPAHAHVAAPSPEFVEGGREQNAAVGGVLEDEIAFEACSAQANEEAAKGAVAGAIVADGSCDDEFVGGAEGWTFLADGLEDGAEIRLQAKRNFVGELGANGWLNFAIG